MTVGNNERTLLTNCLWSSLTSKLLAVILPSLCTMKLHHKHLKPLTRGPIYVNGKLKICWSIKLSHPYPWNSGPRYESRSFWKSGFMTTPSTLGPNALRKVGGSTSADIRRSSRVSRRQSTINSCSLSRSFGTVQFTAFASFTAYVTGSSTTAQDERALPDSRIARLNNPVIKRIIRLEVMLRSSLTNHNLMADL